MLTTWSGHAPNSGGTVLAPTGPLPASLGDGRRRAERFMVLATLLYRASHLLVGLAAILYGKGDPVQWVVLGAATLVSVAVFGTAHIRGWFSTPGVLVDLLVVGCGLPVLTLVAGAPRGPASMAWVLRLGTSSSAVAAVSLGTPATAVAVLVLVPLGFVTYRAAGASSSILTGHLTAIVSSAAIAWIFWWYLRRQGALLDNATARAVAAESGRARLTERIAQQRLLHDTVLSTLTVIAGGGIDANSPAVRRRCAREAAYLRRLLQAGPVPTASHLAGALDEAVRHAEDIGLRVTTQYHRTPPELPPAVVDALCHAVTEALNNVRRHAGTDRAWVTSVADGAGVRVTVTDRGAGFDPTKAAAGRGLEQSVHARLAEVGGLARVDSEPGEGTLVELCWPR